MLWHGLVVVLIDAATLLLLAAVLSGFTVDGPWAALGTGLILGLINAFVWPVLSRFTLRLSVMTLGLFGLLLNGLVVALAMLSMPWLQIDGLSEALVITFTLAAITSLASALLAIDEDSTWYLNVVQSPGPDPGRPHCHRRSRDRLSRNRRPRTRRTAARDRQRQRADHQPVDP